MSQLDQKWQFARHIDVHFAAIRISVHVDTRVNIVDLIDILILHRHLFDRHRIAVEAARLQRICLVHLLMQCLLLNILLQLLMLLLLLC